LNETEARRARKGAPGPVVPGRSPYRLVCRAPHPR